jgi:hypothetical protein
LASDRSSAALRLTLFLASLLALPREARADDDARVEPIVPPTLPSLTHRDPTFGYQLTGAGIGEEPRAAKGSAKTAYAWFAHSEIDYPVTPRRWFFGAAWDVASGVAPGLGRELLVGSPEVSVRGVWSNKSGLSAGGSLGMVVPLGRDLSSRGRAVLSMVRAVRPWDSAYFQESALTARPALDMRLVVSPFLFQLRQGLDVSYSFTEGHSDVSARMSAYVGVDLAKTIALGLELFEIYPITAVIPDDKRAAFTFSPSVRFRFGNVEPGIGVLMPFNTPLGGTASAFFAVRLGVTVVVDRFPEPEVKSARRATTAQTSAAPLF